MGKMIRIGTWQGLVAENDFDRNLDKVRTVIRESRPLALDFLCFPETYLSGYHTESVRQCCTTLDDPRLVTFIAESAAHDTVILVGMSERAGDKIYNTQLVIYGGKLLGKYSKIMLTPYDAVAFTPGTSLPVFEAKGIRFGVVICHDTSFVEPALCLRWKGARLLFTPHFDEIRPQGWDTPLGRVTFGDHRRMVLNNQAGLATLLKMVVVRSDVIHFGPDGLGCGDSNIWNMDGVCVAEGIPFNECIVQAEFNQEIFLQEHWIDRRQVPLHLLEQILLAGRETGNR
jgi:predicted amidohydrolase